MRKKVSNTHIYANIEHFVCSFISIVTPPLFTY